MTLRGAASIIGLGELKPARRVPGRTTLGLAAEVAKQCIEDAGLHKDEVDGLILEVIPVQPPSSSPTTWSCARHMPRASTCSAAPARSASRWRQP